MGLIERSVFKRYTAEMSAKGITARARIALKAMERANKGPYAEIPGLSAETLSHIKD